MAKTNYGKGITNLLNELNDAVVAATPRERVDGAAVYELPLSEIFPNPRQPRKTFNDAALKELADSIREHGIIQPLVLRQDETGKYIIVAGERRFRAAKLLGLATVPCIVKQIDDQKAREISLIENLQREDLNPIEAAEALKELMDMYKLTQEQLAAKIGKARPSITNTLRLLQLTPAVISMVKEDKISGGHARCLIPIYDPEAQLSFAVRAYEEKMSVRQLEFEVKYFLHPELKPRQERKPRTPLSLELRSLINDMKYVFGTKVSAVGNDTKGRLYIDYYTPDDLQRIFELVEKLK